MRLSSILNRLQIARVDKFRHKSESQLPVELTHRILTDFKNAHGTSALHGCSLVCRVWNDICRHYIFHKITIRTDEIVPRLAFLHFTAPHLSEYIRELHIRVFDGYEVLALPEWIPECLTCLKNLYGLYLKGGIIDSSTVAIHQPGLASLLTIPHLRKLTLDGCAFSGQDAVALIRLLSPYTLEELVIQRVRVDNTTRIDDSPSVVTFDALRSLDIQVPYPVLKNARQLECPKLRSAIIRWSGYENWRLPPWIHATLSELTLHLTIVELDRSVVPEPDLGKTIQPTVFNIVIKECDECLDVCSLAKSWIISLPYPDLLRRVTIEITASGASSEIFFPQLADYEVLSRCLQQLRENGRLDFVDLTIEMRGWIDRDLIDATESRELAKLKMGFSALLDVMEIDFTMTCWHYPWFQPILLHHRIERLCTE